MDPFSPKIADVYHDGRKVAEIRSLKPNGCVTALVLLTAASLLIGGCCAWGGATFNGFVNQVRYGVWAASEDDAKALLTATAIANAAPSSSDFFTQLAKKANIRVLQPLSFSGSGSDVSLKIAVTNGDTVTHYANLRYAFDFAYMDNANQQQTGHVDFSDQEGMGTDEQNQYSFSQNHSGLILPPNQTTETGVSFQPLQGGSMASLISITHFQYQIQTLDGLPPVDPREVLKAFSFHVTGPAIVTSYGASEFDCHVAITNHDPWSHIIALSGTVDYTYTNQGNSQNDTVSFNPKNQAYQTIPSHITYRTFDNAYPDQAHYMADTPTSAQLNAPPGTVKSATMTLTLTLLDPGDANNLVAPYATIQIPQTCFYHA